MTRKIIETRPNPKINHANNVPLQETALCLNVSHGNLQVQG